MKLSEELFEDVIVYMMSEIGAMGPNGTLTCLKKDGKCFELNYLSEQTPWEEIKKNFKGINGCRFDGPMKEERFWVREMVIGGADDEGTTINPGWKHIYLEFGNHIVCKEEYFREIRRLFTGVDNNSRITFEWIEILNQENFIQRLSVIEDEYFKQKRWDEDFTQKLSELNRLPEYRERIENASWENGGVDAMLDVLKDYGIEIDFMELKKYCFRQQGLI